MLPRIPSTEVQVACQRALTCQASKRARTVTYMAGDQRYERQITAPIRRVALQSTQRFSLEHANSNDVILSWLTDVSCVLPVCFRLSQHPALQPCPPLLHVAARFTLSTRAFLYLSSTLGRVISAYKAM